MGAWQTYVGSINQASKTTGHRRDQVFNACPVSGPVTSQKHLGAEWSPLYCEGPLESRPDVMQGEGHPVSYSPRHRTGTEKPDSLALALVAQTPLFTPWLSLPHLFL